LFLIFISICFLGDYYEAFIIFCYRIFTWKWEVSLRKTKD